MDKIMVGVTEYEEGLDVKLTYVKDRPVIWAANEAGYCSTLVDLIELLEWVKVNMPELMPSSVPQHLERAPHDSASPCQTSQTSAGIDKTPLCPG